MRDAYLEHMENRCNCNDDGFADEGHEEMRGASCEGNGERLLAESPSNIEALERAWSVYLNVNLAVRSQA